MVRDLKSHISFSVVVVYFVTSDRKENEKNELIDYRYYSSECGFISLALNFIGNLSYILTKKHYNYMKYSNMWSEWTFQKRIANSVIIQQCDMLCHFPQKYCNNLLCSVDAIVRGSLVDDSQNGNNLI